MVQCPTVSSDRPLQPPGCRGCVSGHRSGRMGRAGKITGSEMDLSDNSRNLRADAAPPSNHRMTWTKGVMTRGT